MWTDGAKRARGPNRARSARRSARWSLPVRTGGGRSGARGRWARRLGLWAAALGLAAVAAKGAGEIARALFRDNPRYAIRTLDIRSDGRLTPEMIRRFAGLEEDMNLFAFRLGELAGRLESVPVVQSVRVERKLPGTLVIRVSERIPLARIGAEGGGPDSGLDREGVLLGPSFAAPHLPRIETARPGGLIPGDRIARPEILDAIRLLELCDTTRLGQIVRVSRIQLPEEDRMILHLATGDVVAFPRRQMETRLLTLAGTLKAIQDQRLRQGGRPFRIDMTTEKNVPVYGLLP